MQIWNRYRISSDNTQTNSLFRLHIISLKQGNLMHTGLQIKCHEKENEHKQETNDAPLLQEE